MKVRKGDILATLYASDRKKIGEGLEYLRQAYEIGDTGTEPVPPVLAAVSRDGVIRYN